MSEKVGNPVNRFARDAAHIEIEKHDPQNGLARKYIADISSFI